MKASGWRCALSKTRSHATERGASVLCVEGKLCSVTHCGLAGMTGPKQAGVATFCLLPAQHLDDRTC